MLFLKDRLGERRHHPYEPVARYRHRLRGLAFGSVLIVVLSIVTGYMNLNKGYLREASTAILGVISGLFALFFTVVKKDRRLTIIMATLYFMITSIFIGKGSKGRFARGFYIPTIHCL